MKTLRVRASARCRGKFPKEGPSRRFITTEPEEVSSSVYYRRAVRDGDLEVVAPAPVARGKTVASEEERT